MYEIVPYLSDLGCIVFVYVSFWPEGNLPLRTEDIPRESLVVKSLGKTEKCQIKYK